MILVCYRPVNKQQGRAFDKRNGRTHMTVIDFVYLYLLLFIIFQIK